MIWAGENFDFGRLSAELTSCAVLYPVALYCFFVSIKSRSSCYKIEKEKKTGPVQVAVK
jgi:hypothetical protein